MVQEAAEEGHNNPAYLLNSSLPQRPAIIGQLAKPASYGGRPLGPHSYDVPSMPWMDEPERPTASFASKTVVGKETPPVTAEIDFLNKPELIDFQRQVAPGFHSYTWGKQAQRPSDPSDAKLDKFYDVDNKLVRCRPAPAPPPPARALGSQRPPSAAWAGRRAPGSRPFCRLRDAAHALTARALPTRTPLLLAPPPSSTWC
eukprot:scaffold21602_cov52-Phaeocystis_antarctica.AAC.4